ncbi:hypothetical protein ACFZAC_21575 [Pseudomonas fluorescens]|uniref:hypothetical protein n=1 Tax=Pseudomonas fluorescens TaxID=294 RepID=UPI003748A0FA
MTTYTDEQLLALTEEQAQGLSPKDRQFRELLINEQNSPVISVQMPAYKDSIVSKPDNEDIVFISEKH